MIILAIESSCDETAVALVRDGREVLTDQVFSQADLHAIYGGVVPEIASRSHVEVISQLADRALAVTGLTRGDIDAVAVTCAPGLIGALLVGVNFAKSAALALGVPLIPVHHVRGHIAANYIAYPELKPPFVCLAISGGNTLICDVRDYTDLRILGATRDDAAGECFDKTARVLGLPYPGGKCDAAGIRLFVPPLKLCGDNAAMIGCQAYYEYLRGARAGSELNAWANMEISEVPFYGRA